MNDTMDDKEKEEWRNVARIFQAVSESRPDIVEGQMSLMMKCFEMYHTTPELKRNLDKLDELQAPEEQKFLYRSILKDLGTDVRKNDADPLGNGDQSRIQPVNNMHVRRMFYTFTHHHATWAPGIDSFFAQWCVDGKVVEVQETLDSMCQGLVRPFCQQQEYLALLEKRETGLRLTPLLLVVALGIQMPDEFPHYHPLAVKNQLPKIVKILLRSGANPYSQDALGKSVVHWGAAHSASPISLEMVDMCIAAAETSDLYGKDVVLEGLNSEHMNGKTGIVGGYDCDTHRRIVYIPELQREILIKPDKIRLLDGKERVQKPKLVDVSDRCGCVPLYHTLETGVRDDVAEYLLYKHDASVHIKKEGERELSLAELTMRVNKKDSKVANLIAAKARAGAKKLRDAQQHAEKLCSNCSKSLSNAGAKCCAKCKVTFYCCRECQVQHWKQGGHKQECNEIVANTAGIKLSSDHVCMLDDFASSSYNALMLGSEPFAKERYQKPDGVAVGEKFVVAVRGLLEGKPVLICDKSRTCQFQYKNTGPGYEQMWKEVEKELAFGGKKTFMKASFDEAGECTVYPSTACVKNKYAF